MASPYRINIQLTRKAQAQLLDLQKKTEASSLTDVVRTSLALYDYFVEKTQQGWEVVLRKVKADTSVEEKTIEIIR